MVYKRSYLTKNAFRMLDLADSFDEELNKISDEHRCMAGKVSMLALCELLGYSSVWSVTKLQESYKNVAKEIGLFPYTLEKRFANNPSSKAKVAWITAEDAFCFLSHLGQRNNKEAKATHVYLQGDARNLPYTKVR